MDSPRDLRHHLRPAGQAATDAADDSDRAFADNVDPEADAVVERHDGAWIAVEVKLSPSAKSVDRAARSLLRLRSKVAPRRAAALAGLLVVTSVGAAYRRPDGVQVAPITALGP